MYDSAFERKKVCIYICSNSAFIGKQKISQYIADVKQVIV